MVKITIDVNQDSNSDHQLRPTAKAKKIGLVSAVKLDAALKQKFLAGAGLSQGDIEYGGDIDQKSYGKQTELRKRKNDHKSKCEVIATIGGNYAFDAINTEAPGDNVPFVSLLGSFPPKSAWNEKFLGGVSLESFGTNTLRKEYVKKLRTLNDGQVFLYANPNSKMHTEEATAWNSDATVCMSTVAGAGGANDPARFAADFTAGGIQAALKSGAAAPGAAVRGIIISDDPFFRACRTQLIAAVNTWINGDAGNRYAIYPSQIYGIPIDAGDPLPKAGNSTLYGPDLMQAVFLLGMVARYCAEPENQNEPIGMFSVPSLVRKMD